jgi:hypothetical protein
MLAKFKKRQFQYCIEIGAFSCHYPGLKKMRPLLSIASAAILFIDHFLNVTGW